MGGYLEAFLDCININFGFDSGIRTVHSGFKSKYIWGLSLIQFKQLIFAIVLIHLHSIKNILCFKKKKLKRTLSLTFPTNVIFSTSLARFLSLWIKAKSTFKRSAIDVTLKNFLFKKNQKKPKSKHESDKAINTFG